ncbi:hypothetical protein EV193_105166 [Herbihabitans rhizosphaerae]|uniref:DUF2269 domain-containing protein n=1 Tax=Herbihabitans rhizosphaerae TaxID=1872711 RepID=A0A4Q7KLR6_9PSEU|nr:hypothetical protein [Herbihabitans rhizosphaerae]RZS37608.1 hypothetical protein EV193_105166 [Herbihabitans rhizosphaerae]
MSTTTPRRLSGRTRKVVLVSHIVSVSAWIGIDVALVILATTGLVTSDVDVAATAFKALEMFAVWPMFIAAMLALVTGATLGLGSKYGLFRYKWVAVKLAVNLLMATLLVTALRTGLADAAEYGRQLAAGVTPTVDKPIGLLGPMIVAPSLLLLAVVLSVFKPWGRFRGRVIAKEA